MGFSVDNVRKVILFDLDGTLLPMDQDLFEKRYFQGLSTVMPQFQPQDLVKIVWAGTKMMVLNDGSKPNREAFGEKSPGFCISSSPRISLALSTFIISPFTADTHIPESNTEIKANTTNRVFFIYHSTQKAYIPPYTFIRKHHNIKELSCQLDLHTG